MTIDERSMFMILPGGGVNERFLTATQAATTLRGQALDLTKNHNNVGSNWNMRLIEVSCLFQARV